MPHQRNRGRNDLVRRGVPFQHLAGLLMHDHRARLVYESVRQCFVSFLLFSSEKWQIGVDLATETSLPSCPLPNLGIGADVANSGRFVDGSALGERGSAAASSS
jgi:hypothetical protein